MLYTEIEKHSTAELCKLVGQAIAEEIKSKKLKKQNVASEAGITSMSLYRLCMGENTSLETLLKVLKTLNCLDKIDTLITPTAPSPLSFYSKFNKKKKINKKIENRQIKKSDIKKLTEGEFKWNE